MTKHEKCIKYNFAAPLKVFIIKDYDVSNHFHFFCSVNLSNLYFFIFGFQSPILHKLKNTLNFCLKLNNYKNRSFLVAYSPSTE